MELETLVPALRGRGRRHPPRPGARGRARALRPYPVAGACAPGRPYPSHLRDGPAVYRQRHPERTAFYRLLETHWEEYVRVHEERFEPAWGPLRGEIITSVEGFLECGRLQNGFARVRCGECGEEYLLPYSCRTRCLCPSCQAKRAVLLGEKLARDVLPAGVPHHHVVWTIPRALRGLFQRDPRLLGLLSRCAFAALRVWMQQRLGRDDVVPGFVASLHTFGAFAGNHHPHVHGLASVGGFTVEGEFVEVETLDCGELEDRFRRLVLHALVNAERLQEETRDRFLGWERGRTGFSVHASEVIRAGDQETLERVGRYIARAPVPLKSVHDGPDGKVLVETPPHLETGETLMELDPLDFINQLVQHVPPRRSHMVRYYGAYACRARRTRGPGQEEEVEGELSAASSDEPESDHVLERRREWARLIMKVFEVDPLECPKCAGTMKVISVINDEAVVWRILRHLEEKREQEPGVQARGPPEGGSAGGGGSEVTGLDPS